MKTLLTAISFVTCSITMTSAQKIKGPEVTSLFVEGFPLNNSKVGTIVTLDYNIKALQVGQLKLATLGFLDLEPTGDRKFYFTNNGQVVKYGIVPVGMMFEEAANRIGAFARLGPTANLNDLPLVRIATRAFTQVLNVSLLKAVGGNIQDEVKIFAITKDVPIKVGFLNAEGFYRLRYGSNGNSGQPQLNFRPLKPSWLKIVLEIEQNARNLDFYLGARVTLIKQ